MRIDYAWKRLLARGLDCLLIRVLTAAVAAKCLRYNVWLGSSAADILFTYICYLVMLVIEPCQLVLFGTTIGKAVFGLYPYGQERPAWKDGGSKWQEEKVYECRGGSGRYAGCIFAFVLCAGMETAACRWADFPRHTGSVTAEEFADNFNDYNHYYNVIEGVTLLSDGTLKEDLQEDGVYVIEPDGNETGYPERCWSRRRAG